MNHGLLPNDHLHQLLDNAVPALHWNGTDDVREWQQTARAKLHELLGLAHIEARAVPVEVEIEYDRQNEQLGAREIRFRFTSEQDVTVPCHLVIPNSVKERGPVMIGLQGHSRGAMKLSFGSLTFEDGTESRYLEHDFSVQATREGICSVALEQRCFGENGGNSMQNPDCRQPALRALLLGRTIIGERVWDVMRCIDALTIAFSDLVDTDKIICLGLSGGGTATTYAAAYDTRIKLAVPACAICRFADSIGAMFHCQCNYIPHVAEYFDMGEIGGLIAPRELVMVSGDSDPIFPIKGSHACFEEIKRIYTAFGAADSAVHAVGSGVHQFYDATAWPYIREAIKRL